MKMQRAKATFLCFGSQDVIATSSSRTAYAYWQAPLYGKDDHVNINHIFAAKDRETLIHSSPTITLQITGLFDMWDNYYIFGDCTRSGSDYTLALTGQKTEPTGAEYEKLDSEEKIIAWLRKNAKTVS